MALTTALGGLIGGFGNTKAARTSTSDSTSTSTPGYSPAQDTMQTGIASLLTNLMQGSASPQIKAAQTQSADQINQNYSSLGDRMNRFLSARGFGKSGQVGQAAVKTELGRQGALANNSATYAKMGLDEQNTALGDALNFAFRNPSTSTTENSTHVAAGSSLAGALSGAYNGFQTGLAGMML